MENLARMFDAPVDSQEHAILKESAWLGGSPVTVRFYLGRLLGSNLFRANNAEVEERLVHYVASFTSRDGANLLRGPSGWNVAAEILRARFRMQIERSSRSNSRQIMALERYLAKPTVTLGQLAKDIGTTEKQLNRNANLSVLRKLSAAQS